MSHPSRLALLAALLLVAACNGTQPGIDGAVDAPLDARSEGGRSDVLAPDATADAGPPVPCTPNATLACPCAAGVGSLRCLPNGTAWSACTCDTYGTQVAISPTGHDDATTAGTLADPFLTPARAQTAVRALVATGVPAGGIVVWIRGGTYAITQTLALGAMDSGSATAAVTWRGYPGESAHWIGGALVDPSAFAPVTSASPVWSRLDTTAQGTVVVADLHALGITDYGTLQERGFCNSGPIAALELSIDGAAMPLARWPDATQDTPAQSATGTQMQVYGSPDVSPDVTGLYTMSGTANGASVFTRNGLVGGKQYSLYRWTRTTPSPLTAWFVSTTTPPTYPSSADPFWYVYTSDLETMSGSQGATGTLFFRDPASIDHGFASVATTSSGTQFTYAGTRPSRWTQATDVWLHGMFSYDWADCHEQVTHIDTATQTVTLAGIPGYGITVQQPWYAENLLEEITQPGEWYLDRSDGKLYLWPPATLAGSTLAVSMLSTPIVSLNAASNIVLRDFTLESGRAQLVDVSNSTNVQLVGLTLRNAGTTGVTVSGGHNVGVSYAHVYGTGGAGVSLTGGDRPSLTATGHFVENSNLHDFARWAWMYQPAVALGGVGSHVSHNEIHDAPHSGILYFDSNEQLIELNDIHDVCRYTADAGAIYSGRDWGARGNILRNNYIHAVNSLLSGDVHAVYLDDCLSGVTVEGNIIDHVSGYGIEHGGGRDDLMVNNVFAHCGVAALHTDARCQTSPPNHTPGDSWDLLGKLEGDHYQQDPWLTRYPSCAAIPDNWATITAAGSGWLLPQGTQFSRNVGMANQAWIQPSDALALPAFADVSNNLQDVTTLFVDEAGGDLSIAAGSPALSIPGFQAIPFSSIGIQP